MKKIKFTKEMLEAPLGEVFHTFKSKTLSVRLLG